MTDDDRTLLDFAARIYRDRGAHAMATLFGVTTQAISSHILAVTLEGELNAEATFKKLLK
ncbi:MULTISPECIES: hypothetical protein [Gordonia]|uniref:Uncharacterized protein n=1 Tax=Gordonia sihwensis NBRC 108236 TaxID=1223544 RepID=L7LIA7_9ACTN|nr:MULTISPECIES: hypothetical protein [Gordonia]KXT57531.1 hypothetical protein Y710_07055 [Gordonia sp. QH-12]GAC60604.1 hypothetical protein GSI01S_10_01960 [Gordonia sihwensis NBRC 108236]